MQNYEKEAKNYIQVLREVKVLIPRKMTLVKK